MLPYFSTIPKIFTNHVLIFRSFGPQIQMLGNFEKILKIFDENSIEKLIFNYFWKKIVTKNRTSGKNVFLHQFFPVPGR